MWTLFSKVLILVIFYWIDIPPPLNMYVKEFSRWVAFPTDFINWLITTYVATLTLGSRPRPRGCKGAGQEEARESHHILLGVQENVREWTLTLLRQLPLWEMESQWTHRISESDFRGQNSMACDVLYIIEKILKRICLKWAHITHLDIWNTSYGQKKGQKSNCQFDYRPEKVKNRPDLVVCKQHVTYRWKALDESYNFASDRTSIWCLIAKLWGSKVAGVPIGAILGLPLGSPGKENHLDVGSVERWKVYYKGEGGGFPPSSGRGESYVSMLFVPRPSTKGAPTMH
jgi:hypothetical protein